MLTQSIRRFLFAAAISVLFFSISFEALSQSSSSYRSVPPAVSQSLRLGRLGAAEVLHLSIGLPLRNTDELTNFLRQVSDPTSASYRHYLTPDQFTERFGPTEDDYNTVINFAEANGLKITGTHPNRVLLNVAATVADVERTFQVKMYRYQHPTEGRTFIAPDSEPFMDLGAPVLNIAGLETYSEVRPGVQLTAAADNANDVGMGAGSGPAGTFKSSDVRKAYLPGVALAGSGQTVGLLELDGYNEADITGFESQSGLASVPLENILLDGFSGTPSGGDGTVEVCLDIEMAIDMAPSLTNVIVYEGPNFGFVYRDILNRMATDNRAQQLSSSWYLINGAPDPVNEQIFQQMAAQGQSFFAISGDTNAYVGLIPFPCDSPNITIVGGTALTTSGSGAPYGSEAVWRWNNDWGSSGGVSTTYSIPTWQQGINMTASQGSPTMRNIPDVALPAVNLYIRANGQDLTNWGGTSFSSPLWAGFTAIVKQQAAINGKPSVGFLNPALYAIASGPGYASAFHDVTNGNNEHVISPTKFVAVTGYDLCTGLGSPAGQGLISLLAGPSAPPNVHNTIGISRVSLSWTPSVGAASYKVKRSTVSGGPYIVIAAPSSTNYVDTGVINGATYYYVVSASNSAAESLNSIETSATLFLPSGGSVAAGMVHSVILKADGTVWVFGDNNYGQLGDGTMIERLVPTLLPGFSGVTGISASPANSYALKSDGTVWAWGQNGAGQIGDGTTNSALSPVQVLGLTGVVKIAPTSWSSHEMALKGDGTVWAWGQNFYGELGDGTKTTRLFPVPITAFNGAVKLAAGEDFSLALKSDGTVWACGNNISGQLGDGTLTLRQSPLKVHGLSNIVEIAAGYQSSFAIKNDGTVWSWGNNVAGQLGDGTFTQRKIPVQVVGIGTGVVGISASNHTLALKSDGSAWSWGNGGNGELGDGSWASRATPAQIGGLGGTSGIGAGGWHSIAVENDGTVWVWGQYINGTYGNGTAIQTNIPVSVVGF